MEDRKTGREEERKRGREEERKRGREEERREEERKDYVLPNACAVNTVLNSVRSQRYSLR